MASVAPSERFRRELDDVLAGVDDEPAEGVLVCWGVTLDGRKVLLGLALGSPRATRIGSPSAAIWSTAGCGRRR